MIISWSKFALKELVSAFIIFSSFVPKCERPKTCDNSCATVKVREGVPSFSIIGRIPNNLS